MNADALGEVLRAEVRAIVREELAGLGQAPRLYSVADAARLLGVSRAMAYRYIGSGELRSRRIGSRRLVSEAALSEFIGDSRTAPAADMPGAVRREVSRASGRHPS